MTDAAGFPTEWIWRALVGGGSALLATGTTIFATRKNNEASLLNAVNERIKGQFERQDAEIEDLRWTVKTEREECERKLAAQAAKIDALMAAAAATYTGDDADAADRIGRAAQVRQSQKPEHKP